MDIYPHGKRQLFGTADNSVLDSLCFRQAHPLIWTVTKVLCICLYVAQVYTTGYPKMRRVRTEPGNTLI